MPDDEAQELIDYLKDFATQARVRLSPPVARRRRAAVGQPLHAALRDAVRRHEVHAPHAAHDARGRGAADGGARGPAAADWHRPIRVLRPRSTRQSPAGAYSHTALPACERRHRCRRWAVSHDAALAVRRDRRGTRASRRDRAPAARCPASASPLGGSLARQSRALGPDGDVHGRARCERLRRPSIGELRHRRCARRATA